MGAPGHPVPSLLNGLDAVFLHDVPRVSSGCRSPRHLQRDRFPQPQVADGRRPAAGRQQLLQKLWLLWQNAHAPGCVCP